MLNTIQEHLPVVRFDDVVREEKYCVVRHDVEFSIERALALAKFEKSIGISSTYVFQVCNNNYNPFSHKNREQILEVASLGHDIGVHVHLGNFNRKEESVESYIIKQAHILSIALDYPINRFSIHRPLKEHLQKVINIPGFINMNAEPFFTYTEEFTLYDLPVLYLADSNHDWKYGHPLSVDYERISKMQLNCHPFSWTEEGYSNFVNFYTLTKEKQKETVESIRQEIKTYPNKLYEKECNILGRN